jgi:hypothetical protein
MQKTADDDPPDDEELHPLTTPSSAVVAPASPKAMRRTGRIMKRNADFERDEDDMMESSLAEGSECGCVGKCSRGRVVMKKTTDACRRRF